MAKSFTFLIIPTYGLAAFEQERVLNNLILLNAVANSQVVLALKMCTHKFRNWDSCAFLLQMPNCLANIVITILSVLCIKK